MDNVYQLHFPPTVELVKVPESEINTPESFARLDEFKRGLAESVGKKLKSNMDKIGLTGSGYEPAHRIKK